MNLTERGIIIRQTSEADLREIYLTGLADPAFSDISFPMNAENLADLFASGRSICLTAARKKKVLGFIIGSIEDSTSKIHWILIKENLRLKGIGRELIKKFIELSEKNNARHFSTPPLKNISAGADFFVKNGFIQKEKFVEMQKDI